MAMSAVMERINAHEPKTSQVVTGRGRVIRFPGNWQLVNRGIVKNAPPEYQLPGVPLVYATSASVGEGGG